mmetsp:Transcript_16539/g.47401  ORF Transcript_16539/g.47401 Transcript_16539/m.47401 type:complete len:268 (+) Transcript_16539:505-1308(+)
MPEGIRPSDLTAVVAGGRAWIEPLLPICVAIDLEVRRRPSQLDLDGVQAILCARRLHFIELPIVEVPDDVVRVHKLNLLGLVVQRGLLVQLLPLHPLVLAANVQSDTVPVTRPADRCIVEVHDRHPCEVLHLFVAVRQAVAVERHHATRLLRRRLLASRHDLLGQLGQPGRLGLVDEAHKIGAAAHEPRQVLCGRLGALDARVRRRLRRRGVQRAGRVLVEPDLEQLPIVLAHGQGVGVDALGLAVHEEAALPGSPRADDVVPRLRK